MADTNLRSQEGGRSSLKAEASATTDLSPEERWSMEALSSVRGDTVVIIMMPDQDGGAYSGGEVGRDGKGSWRKFHMP